MILNPEVKKLLEELSKTSHGHALKLFFEAAYEDLNDVVSCETWEDTLGRKKALQILDDLFKQMNVIKKIDKKKQLYT